MQTTSLPQRTIKEAASAATRARKPHHRHQVAARPSQNTRLYAAQAPSEPLHGQVPANGVAFGPLSASHAPHDVLDPLSSMHPDLPDPTLLRGPWIPSNANDDATPSSSAFHTADKSRLKYRRVMLKVSGEALQGKEGFGIDTEVLRAVAREVAEAHRQGVQVAVVVGGGNYFRGADAWEGLERATADYVGMLATVMNALCLQSALEHIGIPTRVQTAIEMREVAEPFIRRRAIRHLENGRVVIFGAGTGNPFFTTDTAAALRAAEINAEVVLKATKVNGIYDKDPARHPGARRYTRLSYRRCMDEELRVMDETAFTLCKENAIPIIVFDVMAAGNIVSAAVGRPIGTSVSDIPDGEVV